MPDPTRSTLEEWLKFFDEMGLGPFYLDRQPRSLVPPPVSPKPQPAEPILPTKTFSEGAPAPPLAGPAAKQETFHAPMAAPSLFDAVESREPETLEQIRKDLGDCHRCRLCEHRHTIVFGVGNPKAELVFVGEGPGAEEDAQGLPFVGRAGQLLTQMIQAMGLKREDVYIGNIIKCRPPENRSPERDEIAACSPFLLRQLDALRPKVICCLGNVAFQTLLGTTAGISKVRGQFVDYRGTKLIATFHPAYLLRNPNAKGEVWTDLKKIMAYLGLPEKKPASPAGGAAGPAAGGASSSAEGSAPNSSRE